MNGIEKITGRITGDTDREIANMIKTAKEEAEVITRKYSAEADTLERDILERGRAASRERVLRLAGVADLEARKMVLGAKQEMLELTFKKAMDNLLKLPDEEYIKLLARLTADSTKTGTGELIFSQADRTKFGKKVVTAASDLLKERGISPELTLSGETRQIKGGLLLKDGDIEINCSFESLMRSIRDDVTKSVSEVLFPA